MNEIVPGHSVKLSPLVRRITQNNPGLLTGPGTNTYLIGNRSVLVLDPGEDEEEHFQAICSEVVGSRLMAIAATHAHPDHWPLAPRLAGTLSSKTMGFEEKRGYRPEYMIQDGEIIDGGEWRVRVLHTPGHASDHVCFFLEDERALFTGDHIMGWSTTVITWPDGDLRSYLTSLDRILELDVKVSYPAHGLALSDTKARVQELVAHRHMRTRQILDALQRGSGTIPAIVESVYTDVDSRLHAIARSSVMAHLKALVESGTVTVKSEGSDPFKSTYAPGCEHGTS